MPTINTGTPWDSGLNAIGSVLFRDPDSIARAGLYGAQQRREGLQADLLQRQLGGENDFSAQLRQLGQPPAGQDPTAAAAGPAPAPAGGPAPAPAVNPLPSADNPVGLAAAPAAGPAPVPAAGPAALPAVNPLPSADNPVGLAGNNLVSIFSDTNNGATGGGQIQATQAQNNGSPAPPPYDIGPAMEALTRAHPDGGPAFQAGLSTLLTQLVSTSRMSQARANAIMLQANPQEAGPTIRQGMTQDNTLVPVWDKQANAPDRIPYGAYKADLASGSPRYRGTDDTTGEAWNAPTRFNDPNHLGRTITAPMFEGANKGGVQVTANGPAETTGQIIGRGTGVSAQEAQGISDATTITTPPQPQTPEIQAQNSQLDDAALQKMYPPTSNRTDSNLKVTLVDPNGEIAARTDELQRRYMQYRNDRQAAHTQALQEFKAAGRLGTANRGTSFYGRHAGSLLTGHVGDNPDIVNVKVPGKNGQSVTEQRLQVHVLPPPGQGGGAGQRGQGGPQATMPSTGAPLTKPGPTPPSGAPPSAKPISTVFGIPQAASGAKPYTSAFQPTKPAQLSVPQLAASNAYAAGGPLAGMPHKPGAPTGTYKGSPFVNTQAGKAVPPAPALAPPPPQAQMPQGQPTSAPENSIIRDNQTGQVFVVHGGMKYPVPAGQQ